MSPIVMSPVDEAFNASCPCDIIEWRASRYNVTGREGFNGDVDVVSPIDLVDQIPLETRINLFVGRDDTNTMPALSEAYYEALGAVGPEAECTYVEGGHAIFQHEDVIAAVIAATEN